MDKNKLRNLAISCRELASKLEAGKQVVFGAYSTFRPDGSPHCALGHVLKQAGFEMPMSKHGEAEISGNFRCLQHYLGIQAAKITEHPATVFSDPIILAVNDVADANDRAKSFNARAKQVIKPLQNLADVLDAEASKDVQ